MLWTGGLETATNLSSFLDNSEPNSEVIISGALIALIRG